MILKDAKCAICAGVPVYRCDGCGALVCNAHRWKSDIAELDLCRYCKFPGESAK